MAEEGMGIAEEGMVWHGMALAGMMHDMHGRSRQRYSSGAC